MYIICIYIYRFPFYLSSTTPGRLNIFRFVHICMHVCMFVCFVYMYACIILLLCLIVVHLGLPSSLGEPYVCLYIYIFIYESRSVYIYIKA